jgi:hypothetical protein
MEREGTINNLAQKIKATYKPQLDRLAVLEKSSKADKEQINKLLADKQKDVANFTKVNKDLMDLRASVDRQIKDVKQRMSGQIFLWRIIAVIGIALFAVVLYMYGGSQLWW